MPLENYIWYEKYRPKTLDQMVLQPEHHKAFQQYINDGNIPHLLFVGPPGSGKTTLALVLIEAIPCFKLILNASSKDRGIETIRGPVKEFAASMPLKGKIKIIFLDECFYENTLISTPKGKRPIKDIWVGDCVYTLSGVSMVIRTHRNKINLSRVIKLSFTNNQIIYCSVDHLFFTDQGWIEAKLLTNNHLLFPIDCDIMNNKRSQRKGVVYAVKRLPMVWKRIQSSICKGGNLFQKLHFLYSSQEEGNDMDNGGVRMVQKGNQFKNYSNGDKNQKVLFSAMCGEMEEFPTRNKGKDVYQRKGYECIQIPEEISYRKSQKIGGIKETSINTHDNQKPIMESCVYRKSKNYQENKGNTECLGGNKGGQWHRANETGIDIGNSIGMGEYKLSCINGRKEARLPESLQNRYCQSEINGGNRSRWWFPQIPFKKGTGYKKREKTNRIRLENSEIYKPGSNDETFLGIIQDKERDQGFVEFYDLTVDRDPTYFAEDILVHNCDSMTSDAQKALRNTMETYSGTCRFILTANYPERILPELHSRCIKYEFNSYPKNLLLVNLKYILAEEKCRAKDKDLNYLIDRFYPDMRSIINTLQQGCKDKLFNLASTNLSAYDSKTIFDLVAEGELRKIREKWAGTMDFLWLYKSLFDEFIQQVEEEARPEIALVIADYLYKDGMVADREINASACLVQLMTSLGIKAKL